MISKRWKAIKAMTLILAFAASQVYVEASLFGYKASARQTSTPQSFTGKLMTAQNKPILVNGNNVVSGTTIFSGAQIQTPQATGATIELPRLGRLDIAPNTKLTVTFAQGKVVVNIQSGYVVLTTDKGVDGSVTNPQGMIAHTDPSKLSSVVVTVGVQGPEAAGIGALPVTPAGIAGTISMTSAASAALVGAKVSSNSRGRGRNLSPGTPRGPQ